MLGPIGGIGTGTVPALVGVMLVLAAVLLLNREVSQ